jgi:PhzF family phenazine biosynthesis protein
MTLYQIDAFADKLFSGNPAAVVPLDKWIDESLMQNLAMENNLAETVFFVPNGNNYDIRWFTPAAEINLCGHATLASAYVLFTILGYKRPSITFHSKSGPLTITKEKDTISMDFPSWKPERFTDYPEGLEQALGIKEIVGVYKHRDLLVELNSETDVKNAEPDFTLIKKTGYKIIITAPGREVDFVSRFFAPTFGVDEDPVTGSAHSQLIPFWSEKLGKNKMVAKQLSKRGGHLIVEQRGDRVQMGGKCVFYMQGEISLS